MKREFIFLLTSSMLIGLLGTASMSLGVGDTWTEKADMPTARSFLSTSVVDGKIYAIGGASVRWAGLSTVEVYDPAADTWTTKTPMPTARFALATSVVDGKIYAIGGGTGQPRRLFSVVEAYDPVTDTWAQKTDMPEIRFVLSASTVDGKVYAIGGSATAPDPHPGVRTVYEYDTGFVPTQETEDNTNQSQPGREASHAVGGD